MLAATRPTVDAMESCLLAWAAWRTSGGCGCGYPTRNVLDPAWSPPSPGMTPNMVSISRSDVQERWLDALIATLSVKLRDALYVVYVKRMSPAEQSWALSCQPSTVRARITEAKLKLGALMCKGFTS